ncbi:MAG: long-chain fatty acid--CoA ligase [candidate division KSB1 bacterium]|nr:long-chain fatty acid--CoA ligase [candidate division KSB1 bacterium]
MFPFLYRQIENLVSFVSPKKQEEKDQCAFPYAQKPWFSQYAAGVPKSIEIPNLTLTDIFDQAVRSNPQNDAVVYFGRRLTFEQLQDYVLRAAFSFDDWGVVKRDRIALIMPNIPQFLICYWALLRLGAVAVPINPFLAPDEIRQQLKISGSRIVIVFDRVSYKLQASSLQRVIKVCAGSYMPFFPKTVYKVRKKFMPGAATARLRVPINAFRRFLKQRRLEYSTPVNPDDAAVMLFTGGVTGIPKGVMLTHKNLVANTLQCQAWVADIQTAREKVLGVLPFFHSYGLSACLHLSIFIRSTLLLVPKFSTGKIIDLINKYEISIFPGVPTMYSNIVRRLSLSHVSIHPVRISISGGAPLSYEIQNEFETLTGGRLVEGYGLTEASPITHCNPLDGTARPQSIGLPYPNTEARITRPESNTCVPVGEVGELQVRGPQVMPGYWNAAKETEHIMTADGWMRTGDLAKMDQDGFFYIVDRLKDVILFGGFNVYPSEVERVLNQHPHIQESAVVGEPDPVYGEIVSAFVIPVQGKVTLSQVKLFLNDKLARYKMPRKLTCVDQLPRNFIGKILRRHLIQNET